MAPHIQSWLNRATPMAISHRTRARTQSPSKTFRKNMSSLPGRTAAPIGPVKRQGASVMTTLYRSPRNPPSDTHPLASRPPP